MPTNLGEMSVLFERCGGYIQTRLVTGLVLDARGERQLVPNLSTGTPGSTSGELNHGMGPQAQGHAIRRQGFDDLDDPTLSIEIDKIDGVTHTNGVH